MNADCLRIENLVVETRIGVYDWEQQLRQSLRLDLQLVLPTGLVARAAQSDQVAEALDYAALALRIRQFAETSSCQLLETFAEKLAAVLLQEFPLQQLTLSVGKPAALAAAGVALVIERSR